MEWLILVVILGFFAIFLSLWFAGVFNTKTYTKPKDNTKQTIQDNINIIMPPSNWSNPTLSGSCLIYNYPIVDGKFPTITNNSSVVETLQSTTNNRCYWSNELGLQKATRRCVTGPCYDDLGNSYTTGQTWSYYNTCGTSCYTNGEYRCIIVIGLESDDYPVQAFRFVEFGDGNGGTVVPVPPNIQEEAQYHTILRYRTSNAGTTSTDGRYCNVIKTNGNKTYYLTIRSIQTQEGDIYYRPSYTQVKPNKSLWFMAPPNSVGGTPQSQKLVFIDGLNMGNNPSLNTYAGLAQQKNLTAIGYGLNTIGPEAFVDLLMVNAMIPADLYLITTNIQFIDISRYNIMINSTTIQYPFYRWSGT